MAPAGEDEGGGWFTGTGTARPRARGGRTTGGVVVPQMRDHHPTNYLSRLITVATVATACIRTVRTRRALPELLLRRGSPSHPLLGRSSSASASSVTTPPVHAAPGDQER